MSETCKKSAFLLGESYCRRPVLRGLARIHHLVVGRLVAWRLWYVCFLDSTVCIRCVSGTNNGFVLGESMRWRPLLVGSASRCRLGLRRTAVFRPWYVLVLSSIDEQLNSDGRVIKKRLTIVDQQLMSACRVRQLCNWPAIDDWLTSGWPIVDLRLTSSLTSVHQHIIMSSPEGEESNDLFAYEQRSTSGWSLVDLLLTRGQTCSSFLFVDQCADA